METNKLIAGIVAAAIAVIVLAGVLMPALSNATTTIDTFTNEGYFRMSEITSTDDDVTITWDYTDPYVFTVNGEDTTLPFGSTTGTIFPYTIMCSDEWGIRATIYNSGVTIDLVLFGNSSSLIWYSSSTDGYNCTFTFHEGTFTATRDGGTPATQSYTTAYYLDKGGEYSMKKGGVNAYLNEDSQIYATGRTSLLNVNMNINVQATIEDGATVSMIAPSGYTISNESVNNTAVSSHKDLYSFSNVTFTVTDDNDPTSTGTATYGQVIVPYEVSAERSVHLTDAMNVILNVIPLLIIVSVLLGVVAVFILRRE